MVVLFLLISCLVLTLSVVYYLSRRKYNYWKERNVPFLEPLTLFGNYKDFILMKVYPSEITTEICKQFPDAPYVGVYYGTEPALVIKDLELIKLITTKDFNYFSGREISDHTHKEAVTQNIFFSSGDRWKIQRQFLSPLLSATKTRNMFYLVKKCGIEFESLLDKECKLSPTMDIRTLMSRFTIDVIVLCAFGVHSNVMGEDVKFNPFKLISETILKTSLFNGIKNCTRSLWPRLFYALGFKIFSSEVNDFFHKLLTEVFEKREYKPSSRNDFVDLLLSLQEKKVITGVSLNPLKKEDYNKTKMEVNNDFLVAQCVAFFVGGFETSSTVLTLVLYELAKHKEVQDRAIADVDAYLLRNKDGVEYDTINEVMYLDACVDECLRLHPLLGVITRETMAEYTLPDGLVLEKGLRIHIPASYQHLNPDNFPNPEEYDPERFLGEKRNYINAYAYLPFGVGPRICLGMKFGKLLVLTGLITVLKKYSLQLAEGTPQKIYSEPKDIVAKPIEPIRLTFIPRH